MSDDYLWDPRAEGVAPDAEVQRLEALLARYRHVDRAPPRWRSARTDARGVWIAAALAAAAALLLWFVLDAGQPPHWRVRGLAGRDTWRAGEELENRTGRLVHVEIGELGELAVSDGARLVAEDCGERTHSLRLERGRVHARIRAQPRVFQIDTPSGRTVDLGCEYELDVDETGAASVRVTEGQIEFLFDGREVYVPAGARCEARPGAGPGLPEFETATGALRDVLVIATGVKGMNMKDPAGFFGTLLSDCSDEDTLTLWHLWDAPADAKSSVAIVEPWMRERIFERLARQFAFPEGVTREGLERGDRDQRRRWRDSMQPAWRVAYAEKR